MLYFYISHERDLSLSLSLLFFPIVSSLCLSVSVEDGARSRAMRSRVIGERERERDRERVSSLCLFLIDNPFVGESQNRNARDVLFDRRERERLETHVFE